MSFARAQLVQMDDLYLRSYVLVLFYDGAVNPPDEAFLPLPLASSQDRRSPNSCIEFAWMRKGPSLGNFSRE